MSNTTDSPLKNKFSIKSGFPYPIPPRFMRNHNDENYLKSSFHNINRLDKLFPIQRNFRILEVGCAAGRLSLPFLDYLDSSLGGKYEGFDIQQDRIEWANQNISEKYSNFIFHFCDIKNSYMNSDGLLTGNTFKFPFEDNSFNLIIFHSVFTHILESEAVNYLSEASRVLSDKNGAIYATFFLWDRETQNSVETNSVRWSFPVDCGNYRLADAEKPELAVAFDYNFLCQTLKCNKLDIEKEIRGSWRRTESRGQDILMFRKFV